jgi:hypothetical protein
MQKRVNRFLISKDLQPNKDYVIPARIAGIQDLHGCNKNTPFLASRSRQSMPERHCLWFLNIGRTFLLIRDRFDGPAKRPGRAIRVIQ